VLQVLLLLVLQVLLLVLPCVGGCRSAWCADQRC
jgi:hypothetical protein